ncbi:MAG: NAD-dependent deacylase [Burkholderiaceae bacterium]|nr:NAD-dependent deacylase [Burkholderiaceae bacterium]
MDTLEAAAAMLRNARRPVIFTGAGMSVDSGVPAFRGRQGGLWSEFDPQRLATPAAYRADRDLVWGWYVWRMALVARAQPHAGHVALASLQARWPELAIVTQNVDDLHERAGSEPLHLHGELAWLRCELCGHRVRDLEHVDPLEFVACVPCGNRRLRPDIVWFGEPVPLAERLERLAEACTHFLAVGTSGVVYPAAALLGIARAAGARTYVQGLVRPDNLGTRDEFHAGRAVDVLPDLCERIARLFP